MNQDSVSCRHSVFSFHQPRYGQTIINILGMFTVYPAVSKMMQVQYASELPTPILADRHDIRVIGWGLEALELGDGGFTRPMRNVSLYAWRVWEV